MRLWLKTLSLFGLVTLPAVEAQSTGRTLILGEISYFVPPSPVSALRDAHALSVAKKSALDGLVPFSVVRTSNPLFGGTALQDTVDAWTAKDDVWNKQFLKGESTP